MAEIERKSKEITRIVETVEIWMDEDEVARALRSYVVTHYSAHMPDKATRISVKFRGEGLTDTIDGALIEVIGEPK